MSTDTTIRMLRKLPLAACLAAAMPLGGLVESANATSAQAPPVRHDPAAHVVVQNCDDSGAGSLRDSVAVALDGDIVDLTALDCSTITLATGAIEVNQNALTLLGPGPDLLSIDGAGAQQVIKGFGYSSLVIDGLTLTHGYLSNGFSSAGGGCVYVRTTDLTIRNSIVSNCESYDEIAAYGGAIFTLRNLTVERSLITGNTARAGSTVASGGGAQVVGDFTLEYSTLSDNTVVTGSGRANELGGAAHTFGNVTIGHSTISGNQGHLIGGLLVEEFNGYNKIGTITNSTISGNIATLDGAVGGLRAQIPLGIYNSTIAFNSGDLAGGVYVTLPLTLRSTIIAQETGSDLVVARGADDLIGDHDLIQNAAIVPPDTISDDPELQPLADNGGPTATHALGSTSPALGVGSNPLALAADQRGVGFRRTNLGATDIGAFETQPTPSAPQVIKHFAPDAILVGGITTLTITLGNGNASDATLTAALTDALPTPLVVADPPNASTTCADGVVDAEPGAVTIGIASGARVPAQNSCTITASIVAPSTGMFTNVIAAGDLQTDGGSNPEDATAVLTVTPVPIPPTVTEVFTPDTVAVGETSVLTITLGNSNTGPATLSIDLIDFLPVPLLIADPANASTTCPDGAVLIGGGQDAFVLTAGAEIPVGTCEITLSVVGDPAGTYVNTIAAGVVQTDFGSNDVAADASLVVVPAGPPDAIFKDGFDG